MVCGEKDAESVKVGKKVSRQTVLDSTRVAVKHSVNKTQRVNTPCTVFIVVFQCSAEGSQEN